MSVPMVGVVASAGIVCLEPGLTSSQKLTSGAPHVSTQPPARDSPAPHSQRQDRATSQAPGRREDRYRPHPSHGETPQNGDPVAGPATVEVAATILVIARMGAESPHFFQTKPPLISGAGFASITLRVPAHLAVNGSHPANGDLPGEARGLQIATLLHAIAQRFIDQNAMQGAHNLKHVLGIYQYGRVSHDLGQ